MRSLVETVSLRWLTFSKLTAGKINGFAHIAYIAYFTDSHQRILRILRCVGLRILQQAVCTRVQEK